MDDYMDAHILHGRDRHESKPKLDMEAKTTTTEGESNDLGVENLSSINQQIHACYIRNKQCNMFADNVYFLDTKNHKVGCGKIEDYTVSDKGEVRLRIVSINDESSLKIGDYYSIGRVYPTKDALLHALANG